MKVLGKKWTMLVLRDVGLRKVNRFNRLLESIDGITPRILSRRLRELETYGFIERAEVKDSPKIVQWALTEKGRDALPVLLQLVTFGSKWQAKDVFKDKKPRSPAELFEPNVLTMFRLPNQ
jgi:DNA-binding HxlR family transcriptional regulator